MPQPQASYRTMPWNKGKKMAFKKINFSALRERRQAALKRPSFTRHDILMHHYLEYSEMSEMSGFDPSVLLGATVSEANTRRPPIPAGQTVRGKLGTPKIRQAEGKKDTNRGEIYTFLEVPVELDLSTNPVARQAVGGLDMVQLVWSTRLDLAANSQGFDMTPGKNNGLRQLREALNLNQPNQLFALPMIEGRFVNCLIKNEKVDDEIYDRISSLAKVA